jgi:hypothetical protein
MVFYASDTLALNDDGSLYDPELMREAAAARRFLVESEMCTIFVVQVDNLIPIVLNRESFSIRGIRGVDVLSGFTERF